MFTTSSDVERRARYGPPDITWHRKDRESAQASLLHPAGTGATERKRPGGAQYMPGEGARGGGAGGDATGPFAHNAKPHPEAPLLMHAGDADGSDRGSADSGGRRRQTHDGGGVVHGVTVVAVRVTCDPLTSDRSRYQSMTTVRRGEKA